MTEKNYHHLLKNLELASTRSKPKMNPDQKLSLCMIVRNEEAVIADALKSVQSVVDEIIVVDTGSTDRTAEIAREWGAKVYFHEWQDDFSAARNESLNHATGDWVLIMDADERIPQDKGENLRLFLIPTDQPIGYLINIKNYISQTDTGNVLSHYMMRMFRRTRDTRFFGVIHEQVSPHSGEVIIPEDSFYLEHWGYQDPHIKQQKIDDRNIPLLRKAVADSEGKNPSLHSFYCFYLGSSVTDPEEGAKWLKKAIDSCPDPSTASHISVAYLDYLRTFQVRGQYTEGLKVAEEGLQKVPSLNSYPDFWDNYGVLALYANESDQALDCFEKALDITENQKNTDLFNVARTQRVGSWGTLLNMGLAYALKKDQAKASETLLRALEQHPGPDKTMIIERINEILGHTELTRQYFEQSLMTGSDPSAPDAIRYLSNIYLQQEKPHEALLLQQRLNKAETTLNSAFELLHIYQGYNRLDLVVQVYQALQKMEIPDLSALLELAESRIQPDKMVPEGREWLASLFPLAAGDSDKLQKLAFFFLKIKELDKAKACFEEFLTLKPNDYEAQLYLAYILQEQEQLDAATAILNQLIEGFPTEIKAVIQLTNIYLGSGLFADAEAVLKQALARNLTLDWYGYYSMGLALLGQSLLEEAEKYLAIAQQKNPTDNGIQNLLQLFKQHQLSN